MSLCYEPRAAERTAQRVCGSEAAGGASLGTDGERRETVVIDRTLAFILANKTVCLTPGVPSWIYLADVV